VPDFFLGSRHTQARAWVASFRRAARMIPYHAGYLFNVKHGAVVTAEIGSHVETYSAIGFSEIQNHVSTNLSLSLFDTSPGFDNFGKEFSYCDCC
jgi:hypothetical protein